MRLAFPLAVAALVAACASVPASRALSTASGLSERIAAIDPKAEQLFHAPRSRLERSFFGAGLSYFWIRYQSGEEPAAGDFKGYSLYADPYHLGLERISFLLGSDCSHFVHRLLQMLGAEYPYLKTRHLIAYLKGRDKPGDLSDCRWKMLKERFEPLAAREQPRAGDLAIWDKEVGEFGEHGHVALVVGQGDELLEARNSRAGIRRGPARFDTDPPLGFLRWRGPLKAIDGFALERLLEKRYVADPSKCSA